MSQSKFAEANKKIAEKVTSGFQNMSDGVVGAYKKIEDGVVGGYKKTEKGFVERYLTKEGETADEAKARLKEEEAARKKTIR